MNLVDPIELNAFVNATNLNKVYKLIDITKIYSIRISQLHWELHVSHFWYLCIS